MTEQEWMASSDPKPMLEFLQDKGSVRKLRLFACACCRRIWPLLRDKRSQLAVEVGEKVADGDASDEEQYNTYEAACDAKDDAWCGAYENDDFPAVAASYVLAHDPPMALVAGLSATAGNNPTVRRPEEMAVQCSLLCDLFGPILFRSININPAWLTFNDATIPKLAQQIYDERRFEDMPILADALMDAGCHDEEILSHCRSEGPHVRGCWLLDLLLGKA